MARARPSTRGRTWNHGMYTSSKTPFHLSTSPCWTESVDHFHLSTSPCWTTIDNLTHPPTLTWTCLPPVQFNHHFSAKYFNQTPQSLAYMSSSSLLSYLAIPWRWCLYRHQNVGKRFILVRLESTYKRFRLEGTSDYDITYSTRAHHRMHMYLLKAMYVCMYVCTHVHTYIRTQCTNLHMTDLYKADFPFYPYRHTLHCMLHETCTSHLTAPDSETSETGNLPLWWPMRFGCCKCAAGCTAEVQWSVGWEEGTSYFAARPGGWGSIHRIGALNVCGCCS